MSGKRFNEKLPIVSGLSYDVIIFRWTLEQCGSVKFQFTRDDTNKPTLNTSKMILRQKHLRLLGYELTHNQIRPDPERTAPLMSFPIPQDKKHLERLLGMFAYYSKFIPSYSEKVSILCKTSRFPLDQEARKLLLS